MTGGELGFLLLASHLGDPERKPLSPARLTALRRRMQRAPVPPAAGEVDGEFLRGIGCEEALIQQILGLLSQIALAEAYVRAGEKRGYSCVTRRSPRYPRALVAALGDHAPSVLWLWGDEALLDNPKIALAGSRDAGEDGLRFAAAVGEAAAKQGFTLVSGGARGVDRMGQDTCFSAGGNVIVVLPDGFADKRHPRKGCLCLCEDSYDMPFSSQRALSRNHVIHSLGLCTFVAQCGFSGGTWNGTIANLKRNFRPVYAYEGCDALRLLEDLGAIPVGYRELENLEELTVPPQSGVF